MSFFSPINFLFLLGTIPIVIMYLLKKRHKDIEISSTFLWQKAIKDIEANAPWQRLRKNLLLILQLLAFIMLVFFLVKPYLVSHTSYSDNLIIVLDNSLSMTAKEEGGSRFEISKKDIEKTLKGLRDGTTLTLVTMGNTPDVVINKSHDKSVFLNKLGEVNITNEADNPEETLSLVKAMTKNLKNHRVIFYTDKTISMESAIVKNLGTPQSNLAIENLSCIKDKNTIRGLVNIKNYGDSDVETDMIIYIDSGIFDVLEVHLNANESKQIYIEEIPSTNRVKVELDVEDALLGDNFRYSVVNSDETRKVLLTTVENVFMEKAIGIGQNVELYKTNEILEDVKGYDLYIYDGMMPKTLPKDGNIFILNPTTIEDIKVQGIMKEGELSKSQDELLKYVEMDIAMSRTKSFFLPKWASPFMFSSGEAIGFKGEKDNQKFVVLGFDIHDTDFPLKYSFPIFIQNVLDYTLSFNMQRKSNVFSGEGIEIDISPKVTEVNIVTPREKKIKIAPPFPIGTFTDTDDMGVYTIEQIIDGKRNLNYFVSNVNTIKESNLMKNFTANNKTEVENKVNENAMKNLKNIFLIIALILLAVEWVVYNRGY